MTAPSEAFPTVRAQLNPLTLSFRSPGLEAAFIEYHIGRSLRLVRASLMVAVILWASFWLDNVVVPDAADAIFPIRVFGVLLFLGGLVTTYIPHARKYFQVVMGSLLFIGGLAIIANIFISERHGGYLYYAALVLAVMYAHGLLRLRFIVATWITWALIGVYEVAMLSLRITPDHMIVNNTFYLVSANVLGMFTSYGLEYYIQTVFWQTRKLEEQRAQMERENERKTGELEAARQIQLSMLPQTIPSHPTVDLSSCMQTAVEIGGDYYDYVVGEDGTLTFAIGDAMGHGARAGAMVTATKMIFSNYAEHEDILHLLNRTSLSLRNMRLPRLFMSLAVGRIRNGVMEVAGAGMPPALLYRKRTDAVEEIPLKGYPLGGPAKYSYSKQAYRLEPGDAIVFMTDGLPELPSPSGEMLGYERVKQMFRDAARSGTADDIVAYFNREGDQWTNGTGFTDDTTILVLRIKNTS